MRAIRIAIFCLVTVSPTSVSAQNILNYHDTDAAAGSPATATPNFVRDAVLQVPGSSLTVVGRIGDFKTQFDMGGWDICIVSSWSGISGSTDIDTGVLDRLETFDAGGGKVIFNAWHAMTFSSHTIFQNTLPCSFSSTYSTPITLYSWDVAHPIWTTPNVVSSPVNVGTTYSFSTDGQFVEPAAGSTAVAGYVAATPSPNNAGILVGPRGAIFNTFTPQQYDMAQMVDLLVNEIFYGASSSRCTLSAPAGGATVSGAVTVTFDGDDTEMDPITSTLEWSTDGGLTWQPATMTAGSPLANPDLLRATPFAGESFVWDSIADGVGAAGVAATELRISVTDGVTSGSCSVSVDVDNVIPSPVCNLTAPPGTLSGVVPLSVDVTMASAPTVDITVEWSDDGGATWNPGGMAPTSPSPNPALGVATGPTGFEWDSRGDGVGTATVAPAVMIRATVDDGIALTAGTCSVVADIDNTALCGGFCGDCDGNGIGPNVLDALEAAQISAGVTMPTPSQTGCCDVDSSATINVIDALLVAQVAAGLPAALVCP